MPRLLFLCLCVLALGATDARAAMYTAPGRTAFDVGMPAPVGHVDSTGATEAVALADGGAVLGATALSNKLVPGPNGSLERDPTNDIVLARIRSDGSLVASFGTRGIARIHGPFTLRQLLARPDGRLLAVAATQTPEGVPWLVVLGLTADGALDRTFGDRGTAATGLIRGAVALQDDGSLVSNGAAGLIPAPASASGGHPPCGGDRTAWVVTQLTASGARDTRFGDGGRQYLSASEYCNGGRDVITTYGGRILVSGSRVGHTMIIGLRRDGSIDPTFHGGQPVEGVGGAMLRHDNGKIDVLSGELVRLTGNGDPDATFGEPYLPGHVPYNWLSSYLHCSPSCAGMSLVAGPADTALIYNRPNEEPRLSTLRALEILPFDDHAPDGPELHPDLPFGGGVAKLPIPQGEWHGLCCLGPAGQAGLPPLEQNSFFGAQMIRLADGAYLLVGEVRMMQYIGAEPGSTAGFSGALWATAKLTSSLTVDTSYGGAPSSSRTRVTFPPQRALRDARLGRMLVRVTAAQPGLMVLRVRDRTGTILAERLAPIYTAGSSYVRIGLTQAGRVTLPRARDLRVTVGHRFRGVVVGGGGGRAKGVLR